MPTKDVSKLSADPILDFIQALPEQIRNNIHIPPERNVIHYSEEIRGCPELIRLISLLGLTGAAICCHTTSEFATKYRRLEQDIVATALDQSQVQQELKQIIYEAYSLGASDIHITDMGSYGLLSFRILGEMRRIRDLSSAQAARLIAVAFNGLGQQNDTPSFSATIRNDARIVARQFLPTNVHSIRLHSEPVQSASERQGHFLAMRLLHDTSLASGTLEQRLQSLGFNHAQCQTLRSLTRKGGLTILAGATGHGKSTVLRHIMEAMILEQTDKAYFSVEDPPEYPILGMHQIQVSTSVREQEQSSSIRAQAYTNAIAGAMRSDPDVLMIGEIRYPEAAAAALDAALTGHAVWATIHAADAFAIVGRLESLLRSLKVSNPLEFICDATVLSGLCYQRLIALNCPHCSLPWLKLSPSERQALLPAPLFARLCTASKDIDLTAMRLRNPNGCSFCQGQGLHGRFVAAECVELDQELLDILRSGQRLKARQVWLETTGQASFVASGLNLICQGLADPSVVENRLGVPLTHACAWAKEG